MRLRRLILYMLIAIGAACGSDNTRTDRQDIEGVDCIVVRDNVGRILRTDCNWVDE